ncbi:MAG: hypothetical protein Hals2KO_02350 [Halioglobus sp.]
MESLPNYNNVVELFGHTAQKKTPVKPANTGPPGLFAGTACASPKNNSNECTDSTNNSLTNDVYLNNRGKLTQRKQFSPDQIRYWREQFQAGATDPVDMSSTMQRQVFKPEWNSWKSMKSRCKAGYAEYSGEFEEFPSFLSCMGLIPAPGETLDRIDTTLPIYSPQNCRWLPKLGQTSNRANTVRLTDNTGTCHSLAEWSHKIGTAESTIRSRLNRGWSQHEAIHGRTHSSPSTVQEGRAANQQREQYAIWAHLDAQLSPDELIEKAYEDHFDGRFNPVRLWLSLYRAVYGERYPLPNPWEPRVTAAYVEELYHQGGHYFIHYLACVLANWEDFIEDGGFTDFPTRPRAYHATHNHIVNSMVRRAEGVQHDR